MMMAGWSGEEEEFLLVIRHFIQPNIIFPCSRVLEGAVLRNQNGNKDERKSVYFFVGFFLRFSSLFLSF